MNAVYEDVIREVLRLAAANAPKEEILAKAIEAKEAIYKEATEMQRAVNILDGLVPYMVPEADWEFGWVLPKSKPIAAPTGETARSRKLRTLEIAAGLVSTGVSVIRTREITERLRSEGDPTPANALTIAVGNILTRSGVYERIADGEYRYAGTTEEVR